jgi:hypothetical protein
VAALLFLLLLLNWAGNLNRLNRRRWVCDPLASSSWPVMMMCTRFLHDFLFAPRSSSHFDLFSGKSHASDFSDELIIASLWCVLRTIIFRSGGHVAQALTRLNSITNASGPFWSNYRRPASVLLLLTGTV